MADWLLPSACLACGRPDPDALCPACANTLPWNHCACRRCALPLPASDGQGLCGRCLRRPPPLASCRTLLRYAEPVDHWLTQLKFGQRLAAGRLLSRLMAAPLAEWLAAAPVDAILPVPLHPTRLRQRGYNQTVELLRPLRDRISVPVRLDWLHRSRDTPQQTGLKAAERRRNLRQAFDAQPNVQGLTLLLVDDVITTGSTLNESARCLLQAGARAVHAWGWARVARHPD